MIATKLLKGESASSASHPTPDSVLPVDHEFATLYADVVCEGQAAAAKAKVVIVGMGRDIADILPTSIERLEAIARHFGDWAAVIVENDSTDGTKEILAAWAERHPDRVTIDSKDIGRPRLRGFEGDRVRAYAEYRNTYRKIAAELHPDADYILAVDLDPIGGWSPHGILNGIGWLQRVPDAACMASTSIFQHPQIQRDGQAVWAHYDQWAFRAYGYAQRFDAWFLFWLPPPGAPPVEVYSSFGACAIYRAKPFFDCQYVSINGDIEHVGLHKAMRDGGWRIFHNPAQRTLMHWLEKADGGQHGAD